MVMASYFVTTIHAWFFNIVTGENKNSRKAYCGARPSHKTHCRVTKDTHHITKKERAHKIPPFTPFFVHIILSYNKLFKHQTTLCPTNLGFEIYVSNCLKVYAFLNIFLSLTIYMCIESCGMY